MALRFWVLLVLIQQTASMENPFDHEPIAPSLFDFFSDSSGIGDLDFDPMVLRSTSASPFDQQPHSSSQASIPQHELEHLIIHHEQLDHGHVRHNPPQPSHSHDVLPDNGSIKTRIGVQLPRDLHPSPAFSRLNEEPIYSSELPGPTRNTDTSLESDSPLLPIPQRFTLDHLVNFHTRQGSSKISEHGHPLDPKLINHRSDGFETNHPFIREKAEEKPPTAKRKFETEGAKFGSSERDARKLSSIQNVDSNHLNPESPLRTGHIADIFPRSKEGEIYKFNYKLIDFEPTEMDGKIVIEAIKSLKLPDGTKFFNIPPSYHPPDICSQNQDQTETNENKGIDKLFCLCPSVLDSRPQFYSFFKSFKRDKEYEGVKKTVKERQRNRDFANRKAWKNLSSIVNACPNPMISNYREFVLGSFTESISEYRIKIEQRFHVQQVQKHLKIFDYFIELFPGYLLYVDIINAISPNGNVDQEGKFLASRRQEAGTIFFQALFQTMIDQNQKSSFENRKERIISELIELKNSEYFRARVRRFSTTWKFLEYWIFTAREDLMLRWENTVDPSFKEFYNSMVINLLTQC